CCMSTIPNDSVGKLVWTEDDVAAARRERDAKEATWDELKRQIARLDEREDWLETRLGRYVKLVRLRGILDRSITRIGGLIDLTLFGFALPLTLTMMLGLPTSWAFLVGLFGAAQAFWWGRWLIRPADDVVSKSLAAWRRELEEVRAEWIVLGDMEAVARR